jgi:hypothetical protein
MKVFHVDLQVPRSGNQILGREKYEVKLNVVY